MCLLRDLHFTLLYVAVSISSLGVVLDQIFLDTPPPKDGGGLSEWGNNRRSSSGRC